LNAPDSKIRPARISKPLVSDINAGFSVAVIAIPQAIAYAMIAQVPAEYGIYTLVIHAILGTFLNHNRLMSVGPTNTQSLLVASILVHIIGREAIDDPAARGQLYIQLAVSLTFLKGIIQLGLAALRLGALARYFSRSVILGFTSGAGMLIALGQLPAFFGIEGPQDYANWPAAVAIVIHVVQSASDISWPAVLVACLSISVVVGCKLRSRMLPGALIALLVTGVLSASLGWSGQSVPCVAWSPVGWLPIELPTLDWQRMELLLGGAFALSVLGMVETYSIGRSVAVSSESSGKPDRELVAQGTIHIVSSFFGCIPGSGSFARSTMNVYAGAVTRYAGLVCGLVVATVFLLASPMISYLPLATLAGQLMVMAYTLSSWGRIRKILRADRIDGAVAIFTFAATLLLPLHYAIFAGVLLNLALYIRNVSRLDIVELTSADSVSFTERPIQGPEDLTDSEVIVIQLQGDLFFGLADDLEQYFRKLSGSSVKVVVIRLKGTRSMDTTVMHRFVVFAKQLQNRDAALVCSGITPGLKVKLAKFGLVKQLGAGNLFESGGTVFESSRAAILRAQQLIAGIDTGTDPAD
jgi:SulP family sulfate permease